MSSRLAYSHKTPGRARPLLMPVVLVTAMVMIVSVMVRMCAIMRGVISGPVLTVVQALQGPRSVRVLAEDQRLDRDRHGVRRHADAAEIDVVEVHQRDAVDDEDFA